MIQGKTLVLILCTVLFSAMGQLFLKSGAGHVAEAGRSGFLLAAFRDVRVVSGLAAWAASTMCWLFVLRVAPLARVYGMASLTYVLVFIGSVYFFGDQVRRLHVVGTALIVVGVACLLSGE